MVNAARRHLTREDRRALAETEIMDNPHLSDRAIAATCGISPQTVASYRGKIADDQKTMTELTTDPAQTEQPPEKPHVDVYPPTRVAKDGRPVHSTQTPSEPPVASTRPEPTTLYCPHCNGAVHLLHGQGGVQRLAKA
jgi:hypothetical protein